MNEDTREGIIAGLSGMALAAIGIALVFVVIFVGWAVGGWFQVHNAKRQGTINQIQAHNYVHNYGYQQAQRQAVTADMQGISQIGAQIVGQTEEEKQALGNQRLNTLMTLCSDASTVDPSQGPLPSAAFIKANCNGDVANPASPYETHPTEPNPK